MDPTVLEQAVVALLLRGDHPALYSLRRQWDAAEVTSREMSGVGCFVTIRVPASTPALKTTPRFTLGDVVVDLPGREAAVGAVLFVDDGALAMLELFAFDGPWPDDTSGFKVRYTHEPRVLSQLNGLSE
jgi:hypothetical protein